MNTLKIRHAQTQITLAKRRALIRLAASVMAVLALGSGVMSLVSLTQLSSAPLDDPSILAEVTRFTSDVMSGQIPDDILVEQAYVAVSDVLHMARVAVGASFGLSCALLVVSVLLVRATPFGEKQ